jgi:hypothetical protein
MNNKITWLLNKAKKLEDESLAEDISALEGLGDTAGVRGKEYKALLEKVNSLIADQDEVVEDEVVETGKPKKFRYSGIKMIGSLYYSYKDKYSTGFATAGECAEHFNGEQLC